MFLQFILQQVASQILAILAKKASDEINKIPVIKVPILDGAVNK